MDVRLVMGTFRVRCPRQPSRVPALELWGMHFVERVQCLGQHSVRLRDPEIAKLKRKYSHLTRHCVNIIAAHAQPMLPAPGLVQPQPLPSAPSQPMSPPANTAQHCVQSLPLGQGFGKIPGQTKTIGAARMT